MKGRIEPQLVDDLVCWSTMAVFLVGIAFLAVRLRRVQVDAAADLSYEGIRQSMRRVQTAGERGRILDRNGVVLAGSRVTASIVCDAAAFKRRGWDETAETIEAAVARLGQVVGRAPRLKEGAVRQHLRRQLAIPLVVWPDVDEDVLARFCEHAREFPGFSVTESEARVYPHGSLAAHVIGYVGRGQLEGEGARRFNFREFELRGRGGLESYYDDFLRGVSGERTLLVDARGYTHHGQTVVPTSRGPDLRLSLDVRIQAAAERELADCRGACVVLDPRDGGVLAMASAPAYDLGTFVPYLSSEVYQALRADPDKPMLNRASGGAYAPGSTFKPITAVASRIAGIPADAEYACDGAFRLGAWKLRCTRRWGHGPLDVRDALRVSCNPFFCHLGCETGTNVLCATARQFGLGSRTGIDLGAEAAGVVPDDAWKRARYGEPWRTGDLAQMSIGQGMLLASPLQMAVVAGALGTGCVVRPHLKLDLPAEVRPLAIPKSCLDVAREGMWRVVNARTVSGQLSGTGRRGGEGVPVTVCGKTGTAEIGAGERKRKNTWFIAYAPAENPTVAVALIVEDGESGGGTAAPKVANVLKEVFGEGKAAAL